MSLTLTIENVDALDNGESTHLRLDRHGAVIGRSPHSDWSLPDPKNYVSSTHCEIDYRDGGYILIDRSTNGTFVNDAPARLPGPHPLKDGDVILIGHYRVVVQGAGGGGGTAAAASTAAAKPAAQGWNGWDVGGAPSAPAAASSSEWGAPPAGEWDAQPAPPSAAGAEGGWDTPAAAGVGWAAPPAAPAAGGWDAHPATLVETPGAGWDAAPATAQGWAAPSAAPIASGWSDPPIVAAPPSSVPAFPAPAFPAPAFPADPTPAQPFPVPGPAGAAVPAAPSGGGFAPAAPASAPFAAGGWASPGGPSAAADSVWGAAGAGPAGPAASGWDALAPARDASAVAGAPGARGEFGEASAPISGRGAMSQNWSPPRVDAHVPAVPAAAAAGGEDVWGRMAASNAVDWSRGGFGDDAGHPAPAAPAAGPTTLPAGSASPPSPADGGWRALLEAAGVDASSLRTDPAQAGAAAGAMLKRLIAGLVVMMEARARAKAQLGAQTTTMELKGNNPIKFARSPDRVLSQMLNPPERGFMGAADAVEDSFRDLQAHQMATLAAMQGALRSTLDRFSPDAIGKRAETRGLLARIIPSAREAALWQAYEREFAGVAKGSDEAFMDVFAKAFKAAYEDASAQMKADGR